jgi:hypothetical protein
MHGLIEMLRFSDGTGIGRSDGAFNGRPVSSPRDLRVLELRYGMIRAQALSRGSRWPSLSKRWGDYERHETPLGQEQLQQRA